MTSYMDDIPHVIPQTMMQGDRRTSCDTQATQDLHKLNAVPSRIVYTGDTRLGSVDETPVNLREAFANLVKMVANRPSAGADRPAGSLIAPTGGQRNSNSDGGGESRPTETHPTASDRKCKGVHSAGVATGPSEAYSSPTLTSSRAPVDCDAGKLPAGETGPASLFHSATRSPLESLTVHPLLKRCQLADAVIDIIALVSFASLGLLLGVAVMLLILGVVGLPADLFDLFNRG